MRAALSLLAALLLVQGPVWAADPAPMRVLLVGKAHLPTQRAELEVSIEACALSKGLQSQAIARPSDAQLAAIPAVQQEWLFAGPQHAQFETLSRVLADPGAGCRVRLHRSYSARLERSCGGVVQGSNHHDPTETGPAEIDVHDETGGGPGCTQRPKRPLLTAGLDSVSSGGGPACVWLSLIQQKRHGLAPAAVPEAHDACLLARQPEHVYTGAEGRPVHIVLRRHHGLRNLAGDKQMREVTSMAGAMDLQTEVFEQGAGVGGQRLSRMAIEAHVKQPNWLDLKGK